MTYRYIFFLLDGSTLEFDSDRDYYEAITDQKAEWVKVGGGEDVEYNVNCRNVIRFVALTGKEALKRRNWEAEQIRISQAQQEAQEAVQAPSEPPAAPEAPAA